MRHLNGHWRAAGVAGVVVLLGGLSACTTTLTASKVNNFKATVVGQVYYLPRSEYQVQVSRELRACASVYPDEATAVLAWLKVQLENAGGVDTAEETLKLVGATLDDKVLRRADIRASTDTFLPPGWPGRLLVQTQTLEADGKQKVIQWRREVDDTFRQNLIAKIDGRDLRRQLRFEVEVTAQATPSVVADTSQTYTLDYAAMSQGIKATDYAVEMYAGGRLKSINVTVDDQTGQVIGSVVSGAVKVAAAAGGFPLSLSHGGKAAPFQPYSDWKTAQDELDPPCKPDVQWKLYQRAALADQSEANAESALGLQKEADKLDAAHVKAIAALDEAKAALNELDNNDPKRAAAKAEVTKAEGALKLAASSVTTKKKEITELFQGAEKVERRFAAIRKALTVVNTTTFRPEPASAAVLLAGEVDAIQAWLNPSYAGCGAAGGACTLPDRSMLTTAVKAEAVIYSPPIPAKKDIASTPQTGVYYRQPLSATLMVCKGRPCLNGGTISAPADAVVLSTPVEVPQFGAQAVLPLRNGPFQNNTISASFAENGALTKLAYKSNAALAKAAEVFELSADTLMKFREAKRNQETSKLEASASELAAKKKVVDAQLALEKSQADLDKFRDGKVDKDGD